MTNQDSRTRQFGIEVHFNCTKGGRRTSGVTVISNGTPVGVDKLRAVVTAQEQLAPEIEKRYEVKRVVITDLIDVETPKEDA